MELGFELRTMNELPASSGLKNILPDNWVQDTENPNKLFSDKMEAIYVYEDELRYWEDIRCIHCFQAIPLPASAIDVLCIISG